MDLAEYRGLALGGGFILSEVTVSAEPLLDAIGRPAAALTRVTGRKFEIHLAENLSESELSISLYHEVLEAATVAALRPPTAVCELNEAGFESAARQMHRRLGIASPSNLNQMLAVFGFPYTTDEA